MQSNRNLLAAGRGAGLLLILLAGAARVDGQATPELRQILDRLDRLERENQSLREEVRQLKSEVEELRPAPRIEEKIAIHDKQIREQEQVKVATSQRFPLRISGMALFNLFANGAGSAGTDNPVLAAREPGRRGWGGTVRQSIIGLEFDGPQAAWGGRVRGSVQMDFFAGSPQVLNNEFRIRTAAVQIDWKSRSVLAGIEKPLFAPRNPTSYSQVGVSPLTAAGNLWRWQPQVRFEQRIGLGRASGLRAQAAFIQTSEDASGSNPYIPAPTGNQPVYGDSDTGLLADERRRPGVEGRLEFWRQIDDNRRLEIGSGFHFSDSRVYGMSVPSNLFAMDWLVNPLRKIEVTGAFFSGQNIGHFGAPHPGITIRGWYYPYAVHSRGGWAQFSYLATSRLSFNLFGGQHDDRDRDLVAGDVGKNRAEGANIVYRLAPNVLLSLEAMQVRTTYLGVGKRLNNHYDLALAYLF